MNLDDIQSLCENKGSEEIEPHPLPNHSGLAKTRSQSNVNSLGLLQIFEKNIFFYSYEKLSAECQRFRLTC